MRLANNTIFDIISGKMILINYCLVIIVYRHASENNLK